MGLNDIFPEYDRLHIPEPSDGVLHPAKYAFHQDRIELHISPHPVAPWWKRLWRWIFPKPTENIVFWNGELDVTDWKPDPRTGCLVVSREADQSEALAPGADPEGQDASGATAQSSSDTPQRDA
jgi:hypothetical protein